MSTNKSEKELAFIQDLYISTDWGERFAELLDEHVKLPKKGRTLYVVSGTGGHALAMQERAGADVTLVGVDESDECVELARTKGTAMNTRAEFRRTQLEALGFEDDQFDLVVGDASLVAVERLPEVLQEMVRVAAPGATVALSLATASSFGEFFSIYWEALLSAELEQHGADVESLITERPTVSEVEALAAREGLDEVESWMRIEEFDYESGEAFLNSPLIAEFLLKSWLEPLSETEQARVSQEIARLIDEERSGTDFSLTIKATLVRGRKAEE